MEELPCSFSLPDVEFDGLVVFDEVVLVELAGGVAFFDAEFVGFQEIWERRM